MEIKNLNKFAVLNAYSSLYYRFHFKISFGTVNVTFKHIYLFLAIKQFNHTVQLKCNFVLINPRHLLK